MADVELAVIMSVVGITPDKDFDTVLQEIIDQFGPIVNMYSPEGKEMFLSGRGIHLGVGSNSGYDDPETQIEKARGEFADRIVFARPDTVMGNEEIGPMVGYSERGPTDRPERM